MITSKLLICAQGVIRNAEDNTISIFSIIESIQGAGFPLFMPKMDVLAFFERSTGDPPQHEVLFRLSIGVTELVATHVAIDFQDKLLNRSTLHIQGLAIPNPGTLKVETILNGTTLGTYEVLIAEIAPKVEAHQDLPG